MVSETNGNMRFWSQVSRPPESALKKINGGRLSGMTDINPQWRYQAMTELFGPIGFGWKFEIVRTWTQDGAQNQIAQFVEINLYVRDGDRWSDPIPGIGGSMFITHERNGLHTSDEAVKMATTDALGTAMKMLGVAADIYAGRWDGSKYRDESNDPAPAQRAVPRNGNGHANGDGQDDPRRVLVRRVAAWARVQNEDAPAAVRQVLARLNLPTKRAELTDEQAQQAVKWVTDQMNSDVQFSDVFSKESV